MLLCVLRQAAHLRVYMSSVLTNLEKLITMATGPLASELQRKLKLDKLNSHHQTPPHLTTWSLLTAKHQPTRGCVSMSSQEAEQRQVRPGLPEGGRGCLDCPSGLGTARLQGFVSGASTQLRRHRAGGPNCNLNQIDQAQPARGGTFVSIPVTPLDT